MHINYDLNEDIEIRLKQSDFIGRVNSLMYSFGYTTRRVLTLRLDSKCSHYYGCEAWDLKQSQAIHRFSVSWNRAMRKVWFLPPDSHRSYLAGLNKHAIDKIYAKSVIMIQRMAISKNSKMCCLVNNSINDQRSLMQSNFNIISKAWRAGSSSRLSSVCSSIKSFSLFSESAQKDKPVVLAIRHFKGFMDGDIVTDNFNSADITDYLDLLSRS